MLRNPWIVALLIVGALYTAWMVFGYFAAKSVASS